VSTASADCPVLLVTGSSGNAGREVLTACDGLPVTPRTTHRPDASDTGDVPFDFVARETWPAALKGVNAVFLMRPPPISDMDATLVPFISACRAADVSRIVFLSVIGADKARWVPHHAVERALMAGPDDWTILRAGFFAQNLQDAYRADIVRDQRIYVPAGRGRVAFLDLRDLAQIAVLAALDRMPPAQAHALTGPEAVSFDEVAALVTQATGQSVRYDPASILGYLRHLRLAGKPWTAALVQTYLHVGLRWGQAADVTSDVPDLLGRSATPLSDYITRHAAMLSQPATGMS